MTIDRDDITGLVLAGGRGSRMGGADKGLLTLAGRPLVQQVLERLAPQVGPLAINANRSLDAYGALGLPVWSDAADVAGDFAGPLAGMLAGLEHATTDWVLCVPCDTPFFPPDLAARMAGAAAAAGAEVVIAASAAGPDAPLQPEPAFCLLARELAAPLRAFLAAGGRKIDRFTASRRQAVARFEDPEGRAFFNINAPHDLARFDGAPDLREPTMLSVSPRYDVFEAEALRDGATEVLERRWHADAVVETHTHPFTATLLVVQGEMWLTVQGQTRQLRVGDRCEVPAHQPHAERYGAEGATLWVARRPPLTRGSGGPGAGRTAL